MVVELMKAFQKLTYAAASLEIYSARDATLASLCRATMPQRSSLISMGSGNSFSSTGISNSPSAHSYGKSGPFQTMNPGLDALIAMPTRGISSLSGYLCVCYSPRVLCFAPVPPPEINMTVRLVLLTDTRPLAL